MTYFHKFAPLSIRLAGLAGAALALGLAGGQALGATSADPATSAASAPAEGARPQVGVLLEAARTLTKDGKYAEALAKLNEAEAVTGTTPYEAFFIDRLRAAAALGAGDLPVATKALESTLASGRLSGEDELGVLRALSGLYARAGNYPRSIELARRYFKQGGTDPSLRREMVSAMYASSDWAGVTPELLADVKADQAANRATSEQTLRMLASAQVKNKDDAGYTQTLEWLVASYPKPDLWGDLIYRETEKPAFSDALRLDTYRLRVATGSMSQAGEYVEMVQLALHAGYPGEAARVADEGFARGLLGTGANAKTHQQLRDQAHKQAAADAGTFNQPAGNRDGNALVAIGFAMATAGQPDKGAQFMQQGIAKGGVKQPDLALLHLGIAQWMAGQKDLAATSFKGVHGTDGTADLAHLWLLLAQAPAAMTASSAAPASAAKP